MIADGLAAMGAVAAESSRIACQRLARAVRDPSPVPATPETISAEWLTRTLQRSFPGITVRDVKGMGGHSGTTARARLALEYGGRTTGAEAPPATMFVKLMPTNFDGELFAKLMNLGSNEVRFYAGLRDEVPLRTPICYGTALDERSGRFVILLEDLARNGCHFTNASHPFDLDRMRNLTTSLAAMHARFWDSPRFSSDLSWVRTLAPRGRQRRLAKFVIQLGIRRALQRHGDLFPGEITSFAHAMRDSLDPLYDAWSRGPLTLVHGDTHAGNLFFPPDGKTVGFLDWQVVGRGHGIREIAYTMCNSFAGELRRRHEREIVELYVDALARGGVSGFGFDRAWETYRLYAAYAWISIVVTLASGTMQPSKIVVPALERVNRAVLDLDTRGALEAALA